MPLGGCRRVPAVDCVAKVIWSAPRAGPASITVTTDWWGRGICADDHDAVFCGTGSAAQRQGDGIHALPSTPVLFTA